MRHLEDLQSLSLWNSALFSILLFYFPDIQLTLYSHVYFFFLKHVYVSNSALFPYLISLLKLLPCLLSNHKGGMSRFPDEETEAQRSTPVCIGMLLVTVTTQHHLGFLSSIHPLFKEAVCVPEAVVTNVISCCSGVNVKLNLFVGHVDTGCSVVPLCDFPQVT